MQLITEVHAASNGTYGARRVHAKLTLGQAQWYTAVLNC
ncbi:transposase [Rhodococcus erythropolis]